MRGDVEAECVEYMGIGEFERTPFFCAVFAKTVLFYTFFAKTVAENKVRGVGCNDLFDSVL